MGNEENYKRLSDHVLRSIELAIEQEDTDIAESLVSIMDKVMTRGAGGVDFNERRDYPPEMEAALSKLAALKAEERL